MAKIAPTKKPPAPSKKVPSMGDERFRIAHLRKKSPHDAKCEKCKKGRCGTHRTLDDERDVKNYDDAKARAEAARRADKTAAPAAPAAPAPAAPAPAAPAPAAPAPAAPAPKRGPTPVLARAPGRPRAQPSPEELAEQAQLQTEAYAVAGMYVGALEMGADFLRTKGAPIPRFDNDVANGLPDTLMLPAMLYTGPIGVIPSAARRILAASNGKHVQLPAAIEWTIALLPAVALTAVGIMTAVRLYRENKHQEAMKANARPVAPAEANPAPKPAPAPQPAPVEPKREEAAAERTFFASQPQA